MSAVLQTTGEQCAREEIAESFALLRKHPADRIPVPCVERSGAAWKPSEMRMDRVVRDLVMDGYGEDELMAILRFSECLIVQQLRDALCRGWQEQWAANIDEARQQ